MGSGQACRRDWVETRDLDEVILVIDAAQARRGGGPSDQFDRVVRDLVMGIPVAGEELDRHGISALGMFTEADIAKREAQADLFDYEQTH